LEGVGNRLRRIREEWGLTLREVEDRSGRIAQEWGNPSYRISASWLDRIEREDRKLAASKLIVLAVIYSLNNEQMLEIFQPRRPMAGQLQQWSGPNATLLLTAGPLEEQARLWLPDSFMSEQPPERTSLLPLKHLSLPSHYRRGVIGWQDQTLDPMITAGASVLIDTLQRSVAGRRDWTNDFNRPIYFLFARKGCYCGYCELDRDNQWLTLIPYALSSARLERWKYRKEIEVIGRVVAVNMRLPTLPT
jgi:transcriptional regulator with XRE-family HTH domain